MEVDAAFWLYVEIILSVVFLMVLVGWILWEQHKDSKDDDFLS